MQVEQQFFIGMQDVGYAGPAANKATNKALVEMLSNTATVHAIKVGQSAMQQNEASQEDRMMWMVINWKLKVLKRPKACETVICRTWSPGYNRLKANRDYEIVSPDREVLVLATSEWVAVGADRRSFVRLDESNMKGYGCEPGHESLPGAGYTRIREKDYEVLSETTFTIGRSMIDANLHMHNTDYLDLANEILPEDLQEGCFDNVEINYRKEIMLHDTVRIAYAMEKPADEESSADPSARKTCIFVRSMDNSVLHATILLY